MTDMKNHEQFSLPSGPGQSANQDVDFVSSGNIARTDKTLNIKDFYSFNDIEARISRGQKFNRTPFLTTAGNATYSVAAQDFLIGITGLAGAPTIGLPLPSLAGIGKHFIIKDEAGGAATTAITIRSAGEKNIDGSSTSTITTNYGSKSYYTDGANWFTK